MRRARSVPAVPNGKDCDYHATSWIGEEGEGGNPHHSDGETYNKEKCIFFLFALEFTLNDAHSNYWFGLAHRSIDLRACREPSLNSLT